MIGFKVLAEKTMVITRVCLVEVDSPILLLFSGRLGEHAVSDAGKDRMTDEE